MSGLTSGRWLEKITESPMQRTDNSDIDPFVGNVGAVSSAFEKKNTIEAQVLKLLYSAKDLIDLPLLREDTEYITTQLLGFNSTERHRILTSYRSMWIEARDQEPMTHRKDNAGRFAANTWIRSATSSMRFDSG